MEDRKDHRELALDDGISTSFHKICIYDDRSQGVLGVHSFSTDSPMTHNSPFYCLQQFGGYLTNNNNNNNNIKNEERIGRNTR